MDYECRLDDWSVVSADPYSPPEAGVFLHGRVSGHKRHEDGKYIRTSLVTYANGKYVVTYSGTTYLLGEPAADYVLYCKTNNLADPKDGIKFLEK